MKFDDVMWNDNGLGSLGERKVWNSFGIALSFYEYT
jgi:hypothetical protein